MIQMQGDPFARGMSWVDLIFECFTVCPILPGLMGICQKQLDSWERWWNTEIKVNPTQVYEHMGSPVQHRRMRSQHGLPILLVREVHLPKERPPDTSMLMLIQSFLSSSLNNFSRGRSPPDRRPPSGQRCACFITLNVQYRPLNMSVNK